MAKTLVAEIKAQVVATLKYHYPDTYKQFRFKSDRWSTGGSIDIIWTDGPSEQKVNNWLAPLKNATSIYINTQRNYSFQFLQTLATAYCKVSGDKMPTLVQHEDGTAVIHHFTDTMTLRGIRKFASEIDAEELEDVAFTNHAGTIRRTSLMLKQDYSAGVCEGYAVIGRQGYAKMSGPNEWFDIYPVVKRIGPHRVKVMPNTGQQETHNCFYFVSPQQATEHLIKQEAK